MNKVNVRTSKTQQFINITNQIEKAVADSGVADGIVVIFVPHTTAGVTINENSDPDVVFDIINSLEKNLPRTGKIHPFRGQLPRPYKGIPYGFLRHRNN